MWSCGHFCTKKFGHRRFTFAFSKHSFKGKIGHGRQTAWNWISIEIIPICKESSSYFFLFLAFRNIVCFYCYVLLLISSLRGSAWKYQIFQNEAQEKSAVVGSHHRTPQWCVCVCGKDGLRRGGKMSKPKCQYFRGNHVCRSSRTYNGRAGALRRLTNRTTFLEEVHIH